MKHFFPGLVLLSLVAGQLRAGDDPRFRCPSRSPAEQSASYTQELQEILKTTRSADAFVLTLMLLGDSDADPDTLIPCVIRNAERLGILGDALKTGEENKSEAFGMVMQT